MVGILTERDLVRLSLSPKALHQTLVREIMTSPVVTIEQKNLIDVFSAYNLMRRHQIRHLPVVDEQQRVIGVTSVYCGRRYIWAIFSGFGKCGR